MWAGFDEKTWDFFFAVFSIVDTVLNWNFPFSALFFTLPIVEMLWNLKCHVNFSPWYRPQPTRLFFVLKEASVNYSGTPSESVTLLRSTPPRLYLVRLNFGFAAPWRSCKNSVLEGTNFTQLLSLTRHQRAWTQNKNKIWIRIDFAVACRRINSWSYYLALQGSFLYIWFILAFLRHSSILGKL